MNTSTKIFAGLLVVAAAAGGAWYLVSQNNKKKNPGGGGTVTHKYNALTYMWYDGVGTFEIISVNADSTYTFLNITGGVIGKSTNFDIATIDGDPNWINFLELA